MLKLRTILLYNSWYIVLAILSVIYSLIVTNCINHVSHYHLADRTVEGYIQNQIVDGDKLSIELMGKEKILVTYYFKSKKEKMNYSNVLGDYIKVEGELIEPKDSTVHNLFSYKKYLQRKHIYYIINATNIEKTRNNYRLRYKIKQWIEVKINNITNSNGYIRALILGDMDYVDDDINKSYQINGVSHLFAISGSHIAFISVVLLYIFKKLKLEEVKRYSIVFTFLLFYMFLTNFTGSVTRAVVFFFFLSINKIYYFNIKSINILLLSLFVILVFNSSLIFDVGFQFSFVISLYLIVFQSLINKYKNYIVKTLMISVIAFLVSIPICSYNFFQINLLSPIFNLLFVPLVTFILFPLALLTFILPSLDCFLYMIIRIMENTSLFISNIKFGQLVLAKPSLLIIVLYYIAITLFLWGMDKNKYRYIWPTIFILFLHSHFNFFNSKSYIVFLDVGQGDSIFINLPHNKGTMLIDTGGKLNYSKKNWQERRSKYSIGKDTIIPYLKSIGVNHLDYLVLTHGDADHMGESINIVDNFKVNKVILNSGQLVSLEKTLIRDLDDKKIKYKKGKEGDILKLGEEKIYVLNPNSNTDISENDNSIVLYTIINKHKVLLMGDAPIKVEERLIYTYNLNGVDILKLGHHGSITSTSEDFLDAVKPKYGIIQVGINNIFGHPSKVIIQRLAERKIKAYLTSKKGTIKMSLSR